MRLGRMITCTGFGCWLTSVLPLFRNFIGPYNTLLKGHIPNLGYNKRWNLSVQVRIKE